MGEIVYQARRLSLGYGRQPVLAGVDLEIRAGQFWFLIGPNGSGKTTLLHALLGLLEPRSGTLERHPVLAERARLGFVPQRCELHPTLPTTIREFVSLGFVGTRQGADERERSLTRALELVDLQGLARASYWSLSGGQRQRTLLARALVRQPRLLILDEPTEGLDISSEAAFVNTLSTLHRDEAITLLVVTHKLELVGRYASHAALVAHGSVEAGPRASVLRPDRLAAAFGVEVEIDLAGTIEPSP